MQISKHNSKQAMVQLKFQGLQNTLRKIKYCLFGPVEVSGLAKSLLIVSRQFSPVEITGHAILLLNEDSLNLVHNGVF